ncbi:uncharacterized protein LOC114881174 isoform X2 [Osmia bicornis bicornis]|uniref:uncharacterized protein LOC114881174 isoform X2 n=1 Tax=Osmia bicornis bicornis TaxID=1437191 RepID=UPI001EAED1A2|nr:uncharacterized protein LOC114881174 isoform X2 [Osmia bicornis bicornis]
MLLFIQRSTKGSRSCMICVSINALEPEPEALMGKLSGYAITTAIQQLNSTRCRKEMEEYRDAVNHRVLWSLKMLDISGQSSSGFVFGSNYWTGNRQRCTQPSQKRFLLISDKHIRNNSIYRNPPEEFPPFELNFFSAHVRHSSTICTISRGVLGFCLPASCGENEVGTILTKMFDDRLLLIGQLYSTEFKLIRIFNLKDDHTWLLSGKMITILYVNAIRGRRVLFEIIKY